MALPKRKTSKSRVRSRKSSQTLSIIKAQACPQCGAPQRPHRVCPSCGFYRGRQVITVEAD